MIGGDNWPSAEVSEWAMLWAVTGLLPSFKKPAATQLHYSFCPVCCQLSWFHEARNQDFFWWYLPIFKCWQILHIFLYTLWANFMAQPSKTGLKPLSACGLPIFHYWFMLLRLSFSRVFTRSGTSSSEGGVCLQIYCMHIFKL